MNGIPVYPQPKNGERPYLATPKTTFWDPVFGYFHPTFCPPPVKPNIPYTNLISATLYFYLSQSFRSQSPGTGYTLTNLYYQHNYLQHETSSGELSVYDGR